MKTTDQSHSAVINLCVHFAKVSLGVRTEPEKNQVKKNPHNREVTDIHAIFHDKGGWEYGLAFNYPLITNKNHPRRDPQLKNYLDRLTWDVSIENSLDHWWGIQCIVNSSIVWAVVPKQCEIEGKVSQVASKQSGSMGEFARLCSWPWM